MQGLDGFETAKRIRLREDSEYTPIIFLTAFETDRRQLEEAYTLGAVDYLVKPLVPVILRAKVTGFVELFQKSEQIKRQAEQLRHMERRELEDRFRSIIENSYDVVVLIAADGTARYVSPSLTRVIGYTPEEFVGGNVFERMHPDDLAHMTTIFAELLAEAGASRSAQFRYRHKDGSWRWLNGTGTNLLGKPGIQAVVGNFQDIDEQKRHEAERQELLLREQRARAELEKSTDRLREANEAKDNFLATLAHELRNPLAPIRNALQIMRLGGSDAATIGQARELMERQIQQMVRLIDDLLDVSRISRGKIELRKERVELAEIVKTALETTRPLVEAANHQLIVELPQEPLHLEADPIRLAQVLANLMNNSAKYTDEGGHIRLTAQREHDEVVVRVRDNGIGIPADMLPRVFDMFTQVNRSLGRSQGGLGIGLTLVQSLVYMHGGSVQVFSDGPGQGSEFVVRLPLRRAGGQEEPAQNNRGMAADQVLAPRRILVVDDNHDAAESLSMLLKLMGQKVQVAFSAPEALAAARLDPPEMAFLDIGMPDMDGYELARRLRADPKLRHMVLVALTGWGQDKDRQRSREVGFDHHLTKPADPEALHQLLADGDLNSCHLRPP
jgi:PAS domain S-box-containing protein